MDDDQVSPQCSNNDDDDEDEDIQSMMMRKAFELFAICDVERKGFITKRDMQRLQEQLPLTPEQLIDVFDSLDDDGNGFLTLEEFTDGFGSFLGVTSPSTPDQQSSPTSGGPTLEVYEDDEQQSRLRHYRQRRHELDDDVTNDDEQFHSFISNLGATEVLDDVDGIRLLWGRIRRDQPELLGNLEDFLHRITTELKRTHTDYRSLESALKSKSLAHDEEVRKLYEEMELQIQAEKQRIINEERARERQLKEDMERDVMEKDKQLQELIARHCEMQKKLENLNSQEAETKQENEKLQKEKEELEEMLDESQHHLDESRAYINQLRQQQRDEKRERALAALHVTEGIAMERESLVRQLDLLRDMNRKLRDDRDEAELRRLIATNGLQQELGEVAPGLERSSSMTSSSARSGALSRAESFAGATADGDTDSCTSLAELRQQQIVRDLAARRRQLTKRGSIMSNYVGVTAWKHEQADLDSDIEIDDDDVEFDDEGISSSDTILYPRKSARRGNYRQPPLGANSSLEYDDNSTILEQEVDGSTPERLFKVVFVGDSSVGKSTFIYRLCNNAFQPNFRATIGVDFQVKNLRVDGHVIALQLWDTAGQERFRSITKQYFRKADGVIIMYDVTSESSFRSVRNWMTSVKRFNKNTKENQRNNEWLVYDYLKFLQTRRQDTNKEGTEDETVIVMIGNKLDLVADESPRIVSEKDGTRLADEFGALFYETSAKSGVGIREAMEAMARLLREREDREMEKALQLSESAERKRGCCNY